MHETPFTDDEESDEDDYEYQWGNTSVIPPVFADGIQPFTSPAPSMPVPLSYTGSNYSSASPVPSLVRSTSSRQSYRTAYTYPVHRSPSASSTSSYVPAWIDPRHYDTPLTVMQTPPHLSILLFICACHLHIPSALFVPSPSGPLLLLFNRSPGRRSCHRKSLSFFHVFPRKITRLFLALYYLNPQTIQDAYMPISPTSSYPSLFFSFFF